MGYVLLFCCVVAVVHEHDNQKCEWRVVQEGCIHSVYMHSVCVCVCACVCVCTRTDGRANCTHKLLRRKKRYIIYMRAIYGCEKPRSSTIAFIESIACVSVQMSVPHGPNEHQLFHPIGGSNAAPFGSALLLRSNTARRVRVRVRVTRILPRLMLDEKKEKN